MASHLDALARQLIYMLHPQPDVAQQVYDKMYDVGLPHWKKKHKKRLSYATPKPNQARSGFPGLLQQACIHTSYEFEIFQEDNLDAPSSQYRPDEKVMVIRFASHLSQYLFADTSSQLAIGVGSCLYIYNAMDAIRIAQFPDEQFKPVAWEPPLEGHTQPITAVVFSHDGEMIATASEDQTAKLWHVASADLSLTLHGHQDTVTAVAFSPDANQIATASADRTVKLWDTANGSEHLTLSEHPDAVTAVAYSPDGTNVATASADGTARLWCASSGECLHTLQGHQAAVLGVSFSPCGQYVATASADGTAKWWDVTSGEAMATLEGHQGAVTAVVFSSDGETLATASQDATAAVWERNGHRRYTISNSADGEVFISCNRNGKNGQRVAIIGQYGTATVWSATATRKKVLYTLTEIQKPVQALAFSPVERRIALASAHTLFIGAIPEGAQEPRDTKRHIVKKIQKRFGKELKFGQDLDQHPPCSDSEADLIYKTLDALRPWERYGCSELDEIDIFEPVNPPDLDRKHMIMCAGDPDCYGWFKLAASHVEYEQGAKSRAQEEQEPYFKRLPPHPEEALRIPQFPTSGRWQHLKRYDLSQPLNPDRDDTMDADPLLRSRTLAFEQHQQHIERRAANRFLRFEAEVDGQVVTQFDRANDVSTPFDVPADTYRLVIFGEDATGRVPLGSFEMPASDEDAGRTTLMTIVPESGLTVTFDLAPVFDDDDDVVSWTTTVRCQAEEGVQKDAAWYEALLERLSNDADFSLAMEPASTHAALAQRLQPRLEELHRYAQSNPTRDGRRAYFQAELGDLFLRLDFAEQARTCWASALTWAQDRGRDSFVQAMQSRLTAAASMVETADPSPALPSQPPSVASQLLDQFVQWASELWRDPWLGQMATASAATHLTEDFPIDASGFIRVTCEWQAADATHAATLIVTWEADTSRAGEFWLQFTDPNDPSRLLSEQSLGDRLSGQCVLDADELGFDPTRVPWAVRILLVDQR